jgi:hypothetical protein
VVPFRERVFENLIGDLEYHPRRAALYLGFGVVALCAWIFPQPHSRLEAIPLVFGAGGVAFLLKGVFLLRRSSDGLMNSTQGLNLSRPEHVPLSVSSTHKSFPSYSAVVAQLIQDFGAGALLLGPVLHFANEATNHTKNLPSLAVLCIGAGLFAAGWLIRRLTSSSKHDDLKYN